MGPERIYKRSAGPRVQGLSVERDPVAPAALSDAARLRSRAEPRETRHDMHPRGPDGHAPQLFGEVGGSGAAWLAAASQRSHPWPAAPAGPGPHLEQPCTGLEKEPIDFFRPVVSARIRTSAAESRTSGPRSSRIYARALSPFNTSRLLPAFSCTLRPRTARDPPCSAHAHPQPW